MSAPVQRFLTVMCLNLPVVFGALNLVSLMSELVHAAEECKVVFASRNRTEVHSQRDERGEKTSDIPTKVPRATSESIDTPISDEALIYYHWRWSKISPGGMTESIKQLTEAIPTH